MKRCETIMEGDSYCLVRYEIGDGDELYRDGNAKPAAEACADLFLDPAEWTAVGMPVCSRWCARYWLHDDGTLCRILKR